MSVAGDRVGTIVLQRRLGVGGMGEVWAGHDERLDRKVAVKILRDELLDAESRLRLRREARMLSRLEHPGVCRLYDLIEDEGASALVLELVEGRSLREVLDDDDPPRRERLRLALDVADALVAAHLAGMVHRDLKLNNIRVRPDGRAVLLDFGLARPTDARPIATRPLERSMLEDPGLSRLGATPGTVGNMSPEQARGEEVTPASDVYAFGLLLHELLGRVAPYPPGLGVEELRIKAVEGDLRPLEGVDRATVELIRSLERGEPAERPSMLEVRQRLQALAERPARRRRRLIAAAVAIGVLVGGAKVASDLERERRAALAAKSVADSAREEAVERRREAEQTVAFLESLFEGSDPAAARGRETSARELLERGAERIHADLADQPLVSARLLRTIGRVSQSLGDFERAERLIAESIALRRTHRPEATLEIAHSEVQHADVLYRLGRLEDAGEALERSMPIMEASARPIDLADALNVVAGLHLLRGEFEPARGALERSLELRRQVEAPPSGALAGLLNNLADAERGLNRIAEAETLDRRVLAMRRNLLGDDHPEVATSLNNLSIDLFLLKRHDEAKTHLEEALSIWRKTLGPDHPNVATAHNNLGELAALLGRSNEAQERFERALDIWQRTLGPEHPDVAFALHNLARLAAERGDRPSARSLYRRALDLRQRVLPPQHPNRLETEQALAALEADGNAARPTS